MSGPITLKAALARYMDPGAFRESVPDSVKHTCPTHGRTVHDKLKARRDWSMKRAEAAIRFFSRPENREWLDKRVAALASVDTHPQGGDSTKIEAPFMSGAARSEAEGDAQIPSQPPSGDSP